MDDDDSEFDDVQVDDSDDDSEFGDEVRFSLQFSNSEDTSDTSDTYSGLSSDF